MSAAEVRVLGPIEVVGDDGPVRLSAEKQRRLLAVLAAAAGRACSVDELLDGVWGARPPASAPKLLQVYVSQLRKALPPPIRVTTLPGAYVLEVPAGGLDAERFDRLAEESRDARAAGNPALAVSLARQALLLWRGRAFGEFALEEFARAEAERLEERRLVVHEERLTAQLQLGAHAEVLGEVVPLADRHPDRGRLQELAMLALYRAGRQQEALAHYANVRARMRDELGLEPALGLRELQTRILRHDPELAAPEVEVEVGLSLPVGPNPLIGRERELGELRRLLLSAAARLVVLTGAGGSGKTRLALAAAREVAPSFANGAVLVELASLREPGLVAPTIAQALDVAEVAGEPVEKTLARALASRELLLVVDNAEHVREAAPLFSSLVARAPRLCVLLTSRAVLHVSGEHVFPVGPLGEEAAVELFVRRAQQLDPTFAGAHEDDDVREVCRRLDGLPLAIELAAARVRTLPPRVLRDRLRERLDLLTGGPRDVPARQQTLRATIDWSVGLLPEAERRVLAQLSVFANGAALAAAEDVCAADVDTVGALVDDHLLRRVDVEGEPRFVLLETIREYAAELRVADAELDARVRRRYAAWCLDLAERAEPELSGERQAFWFSLLEAEHDNLRAGLAELEAEGAHDALLRLTVALFRFWYVRGHLAEARKRLERAIDLAQSPPAAMRRRALTAAAAVCLLQGDYPGATAFAEAGLVVARETEGDAMVANALSNLGAIVLAAGETDRARTALEEAVPLARAVGDERILALALNNLGDVELTIGRYEAASPLFDESLALLRARGDTANIARSLFNAGAVDLMLGRLDAANERFRESIELSHEAGSKEDLAWCLEGLAGLAVATDDGERAALLLGSARSQLSAMGAEFKPFERRLHESTVERASELCGADRFATLLERGSQLTTSETLELARAVEPATSRPLEQTG